jgi:hypothetical protein
VNPSRKSSWITIWTNESGWREISLSTALYPLITIESSVKTGAGVWVKTQSLTLPVDQFKSALNAISKHEQMTTNPRKTTKAEIKSVALLIRESATEIAIAMIRSGQFVVGAPGTSTDDLGYYAVRAAEAIAVQSFHVAPRIVRTIEDSINEEPED